jgi:NTE family protein
MGVLFQSFAVMSSNILSEKLKQQRPTIYVRPDIRNIRILEFYKAPEVFAQAHAAQQLFRQDLNRAMLLQRVRPGCSSS